MPRPTTTNPIPPLTVRIQELLDGFDSLLAIRGDLKAVEFSLSDRVTSSYIKVMEQKLLGDLPIQHQARFLEQIIKSRSKMKSCGLDTNPMDNLVAKLLGKMKDEADIETSNPFKVMVLSLL